MTNARPYQTVPTVELARTLRELREGARHYATDTVQRAVVRDISAELSCRVIEARAANSQGIGVAHGAPERWAQ